MSYDDPNIMIEPLKIEGLNIPPKSIMDSLGTFKLKDKEGRNTVQIDLSKATRPLTDALYLFVVKVPNETNKVKIFIQWKNEIPLKKDNVQLDAHAPKPEGGEQVQRPESAPKSEDNKKPETTTEVPAPAKV